MKKIRPFFALLRTIRGVFGVHSELDHPELACREGLGSWFPVSSRPPNQDDDGAHAILKGYPIKRRFRKANNIIFRRDFQLNVVDGSIDRRRQI